MTTLTPEHQSRLDRELDDGEEIRWVSQPNHRLMRRQAIQVWLYFLFVVGFFVIMFASLAWISSITPPSERQDEPEGFLIMIGAIIGLWFAAYPFILWCVRSIAKNTIYAITDKRAVIIRVHRDGSITERDYRGDELIHLARKEFKDGSGTLTFESARGAGHTSQTASRHKFQAIENVIQVERMLRDQFGSC
jgi:hypothetical protein